MKWTPILVSAAFAGAGLLGGTAAFAGNHEPGLQPSPGNAYHEKVPQTYVEPSPKYAVGDEVPGDKPQQQSRNEGGRSDQAAMSGQGGGASRAEIAALEVQTATKHAGFAAQAKEAAGAHKHLQHTINCLVGKDDPAYDPSAEDPCKGQGQGAIADAEQAPGAERAADMLKEAKGIALKGKQKGEAGATTAANRVQSLLQQAEQALQRSAQ